MVLCCDFITTNTDSNEREVIKFWAQSGFSFDALVVFKLQRYMREKQSRRVKGKVDISGISCIEEVVSSNISVRKLGRSYPSIYYNQGGQSCPKTIAQFWICSGWSHDRVMYWTSLVVQYLRTCLPMLGTLVLSLYWKILHAIGQLSLCTTTTAYIS